MSPIQPFCDEILSILQGQFYRLTKAKEEFLNPLLLDMFGEHRLQVIYEDDGNSEDDYCYA